MEFSKPLIIDGHNDVLTKLMKSGGVSAADAFIKGNDNDIDLPKAQAGGLAAGFFAIWVPSPPQENDDDYKELMCSPSYDIPLPPQISQTDALAIVMEEAAILIQLHAKNALRICTSVAAIRECMASGTLAAIMHMEGAEAIDPDFHVLEVLYRAGLRSLGPVWSRPTIYGEGVPFRFPSSPDTGGGLTTDGIRLVHRCNDLGILVDLSHITEAGFNDVAKHSSKPLVASHSNSHTLCEQSRNLTDRQLMVIAESQGLVGINFAAAFLSPDGKMQPDVPLDVLLRHLDHMLEILGEDGVALGSDFDGAVIPEAISDAAGLPKLREAMENHGYNKALMNKLCHGNWLQVLERTWGE
ncbi:MAG: dipeptidase [Gammaproteobacteria bacterium]|nr:dipeptidase [Gammaproteobacteria bacterium]